MSVTQQIIDALAAADEPLNIAELAERCSEAKDTTQIASICHGLTKRGALTRETPPNGGRFLYRLAPGAQPGADDEPPPQGCNRGPRVAGDALGKVERIRPHLVRADGQGTPFDGIAGDWQSAAGSAWAFCACPGRAGPPNRDHRPGRARPAAR